MSDPEKKIIEFSTWGIIKVILVLLGFWLIFAVRDILILLFVVFVLVSALEPTIKRMENYGLPRILGAIIVYLVLILVFSLIVYLIVPPLVLQIQQLAVGLPGYIERINAFGLGETSSTELLNSLSRNLSKLGGGVFTAITTLFGSFVSTLTVLALAFYILLDQTGLKTSLFNLIPEDRREGAAAIFEKISLKLGTWLRSQLTLMIIMGVVTGVALAIIRVPYALTLGLLTGVLEVVPIIGPIIAGLIALAVVAISGGLFWQILAVLLIYILSQQLENQILVPNIMKRAIGISPIIVIVALLVGGKLMGMAGAILAIPLVAMIQVLIQDWPSLKRKLE